MNFWTVHGVAFLVGMVCVPRLTMLVAAVTPFGWLAWLGWVVWPNLLAAVLATTFYWETNPWLCTAAWLVMLSKAGGAGRHATNEHDALNGAPDA
jgi:hypothetical protein